MVVYIKKVQLINYSVHVALQWISGREGCIKQLSRVSSESVMGYFNPRLGQWSTDYLYNCRWSASTQDSRNRIQEGLARLEQWSEIKRMQFNKDKHEVATISCTGINGTSSWVQSHRRESSLKKKISQKYQTLNTSVLHGGIHTLADILFYLALLSPYLIFHGQFWIQTVSKGYKPTKAQVRPQEDVLRSFSSVNQNCKWEIETLKMDGRQLRSQCSLE